MPKRPVHVIRYRFIKCCIWENRTKNGNRHAVTLCRLFKNGDAWQESTRFGRDDLLVAAKAIDEAHTWIHQYTAAIKVNDVQAEAGD